MRATSDVSARSTGGSFPAKRRFTFRVWTLFDEPFDEPPANRVRRGGRRCAEYERLAFDLGHRPEPDILKRGVFATLWEEELRHARY